MFKVNNKNIRTTFSSISIADFEQVNVSWEVTVLASFRLLRTSPCPLRLKL